MLWVCSKKDIFTEPLGAKIEGNPERNIDTSAGKKTLKKCNPPSQLRFVENVDISSLLQKGNKSQPVSEQTVVQRISLSF